ncbi:hypothetical protein COX00_01150 [Candidatus Uhrbacteria bacterium CG22_combo_CG10-13_8_21_14_all_47_17]|uniref:UPF0235 protein COX00_01150 n=1 Tax=Candidatus Uhrbacteria bacterium CG22_combo_CG10-13_8_21_14_all_47_17 TaxID=1975041 RepID=A0A2H0BT36_9BACT|nr:MAG: hypothetical protein COX00_01150 [Candidatus Uhrbacteria bacterium CG22_combo_CG10-13_8_21_14_all_47_17]
MKLSVKVLPNAKRSEIVGWLGSALKIKLSAPPMEGRANNELINFLSDFIHCSKSEVTIERGLSGKLKRITLPIDREELDNLLRAYFSGTGS